MNRLGILLLLLWLLACHAEQQNDTSEVGKKETVISEPPSLEGQWVLRMVDDTIFNMSEVYGFESPQPKLELAIKENKLGGHSGCNSFGGTAYFEGKKIVLPEPVIATQMGCGGNVWENDFFHRLMTIDHYTLSPDTLKLFGEEEKNMVFVRN